MPHGDIAHEPPDEKVFHQHGAAGREHRASDAERGNQQKQPGDVVEAKYSAEKDHVRLFFELRNEGDRHVDRVSGGEQEYDREQG